MHKLYHPYAVQEKIDEIQGAGIEDNSNVQDPDDDDANTYRGICCNPLYSRATFVGCMLSIFQQLTGINFIIFYSNKIFEKTTTMDSVTITELCNVVNFVSTFGGIVLLSCAGRKTIMVICNFIMAAILITVGLAIQQQWDTVIVVCILAFIAFFEFSSGPITWLYMSEIMQDKATSIGTVLNWLVTLVVSAITPSITDPESNIPYIFYSVGALTVCGALFMIVFMKETKGKTQKELEELYVVDRELTQLKKKVITDKDDYGYSP